ncbi:MAG TPA: hypothetical protein VHC44_08115, partial [Verrucomicrobiae bacterium]|nr:hypothetical protein [Verrucomicrobiae bacterium]
MSRTNLTCHRLVPLCHPWIYHATLAGGLTIQAPRSGARDAWSANHGVVDNKVTLDTNAASYWQRDSAQQS